MDARTLKAKQKYEGNMYFTSDGKERFIVKKFNSGSDIEILFPDAVPPLIMHKSSHEFSRGIKNPFANSCVHFDDLKLAYEGCQFLTNEGYLLTVIEYNGTSNVRYRIEDWAHHEGVTTMQNIRKGQVHNPYHVNKFGGYEGVSKYVGNKTDYESYYRVWYNMLIRANDTAYYLEYHGSNTAAYDNCTIDPAWLCFSNFAEWYDSKLAGLNPEVKYELDKDLLYRFYSSETNGMKSYGPRYCVLIPHELNNKLQFFNANLEMTKEERDAYAKSVVKEYANKYYSIGALDPEVYNIIMNL